MCGIFGWFPGSDWQKYALAPVAETLFQDLRHRGPDDRGYVIFDQKGAALGDETTPHVRQGASLLGHTRLSIIDVSRAGHQPMATADRRYFIVYNGEIYNYLELREELRKEGVRFATETDTEVLLQAYATWGAFCLDKLNGMYAFAVYDTMRGKLFCARDCFGIKPFFWHAGRNGFAFASEIPALLHIPGIERVVDSRQAYAFLRHGLVEHAPQTMIRGIRRLQPAHWMEFDLAACEDGPERISRYITTRRYWTLPLGAPLKISFKDAAQTVRELFLHNIRLHLRSDVTLGVALSGGIDSSSVACAVRHVEPDAELHTFSYIADEELLSEETWGDLAATSCNAVQHKTMPCAEDLLRDMDAMTLHMGEPFTTTSMYAQFTVMRLAQETGVKVLLEGQGADEFFAGYDGYLTERVQSLIKRKDVQGAMQFLQAAARWPGREKLVRDVLRSLGLQVRPEENQTPEGDLGFLLQEDAFSSRNGNFRSVFNPRSVHTSDDKVRERLARQIDLSLPGLFRNGDRNAMAFSIENRVPFCTRELVEFSLSLPEAYLIDREGCSKSVLREAMRGIVPDAILDRRDKIGFEAPGKPWLEKLLPWMLRQIIEQESAFFDKKALIQSWKAVMAGQRGFDWFYWRVISYLRWKALLGMHE